MTFFYKYARWVAASILLTISPAVLGASITTQESAMDAIFSQASFGMDTIDIRYGPAVTIVAPDLLDITTNAEIDQLVAMHTGPANVVNFFYIDTISVCGPTMDVNIIGCAETPGNDFIVESAFAAAPGIGGELLAHELAHNLGLPHTVTGLMAPAINGDTTLTVMEVAAILMSPLVQIDASTGQRFIQITPVLVTAVPLPAAVWLMITALGGLAGLKRLRPTQSQQPAIA